MINFEANIRTLERGPLLLLDNGSVVATLFLAEVRRRKKTVDIDLATTNILQVYDQVLALDNDVLPIFLVPKKIKDVDKGNLVHFMLKREEFGYKGRNMEFEQMRYLVVAEGQSIDDIDANYCPVSFGMMCYIPEPLKKLKIVGMNAIGMTESGAVRAYHSTGKDWEKEENEFAVAAEIAEKIGLERDVRWDKSHFYKELFHMLEQCNCSLADSVRADIKDFLEKNEVLFFNERDFQMNLAVYLINTEKYDKVFVEYSVPKESLPEYAQKWNSDVRLDLVVRKGEEYLPIELKYKTKKTKELNLNVFGKEVDGVSLLKTHGAPDLGRYDFWKDVRRLELVRKEFKEKVKGGIAVFLTNDPAYKKDPSKDAIDYQFSMSDDTHLKEKQWTDCTCAAAQGRPNFTVEQDYAIEWNSVTIDEIEMHYCIVTI